MPNDEQMTFDNLIAYWQCLADAFSGRREETESRVSLFTGSTYALHNPVFYKTEITANNISEQTNGSHWILPAWNKPKEQLFADHKPLLQGGEVMFKSLAEETKVPATLEGLSFKSLEQNDFTQWAALLCDGFAFDPDTAAAYTECLQFNDQKLKHFAAVYQQQIIGTITLFSHRPEIVGIYNMTVDPQFRGQSVAGALLANTLNLARKEYGYSWATLQSLAPAVTLSQRAGFKSCSALTVYQSKQAQ